MGSTAQKGGELQDFPPAAACVVMRVLLILLTMNLTKQALESQLCGICFCLLLKLQRLLASERICGAAQASDLLSAV